MENIKITFKKYPAYKKSAFEWLGEIPIEWEQLSNKYIFSLKKILVGKSSKNYDLLSLTLNGIILRDMENPQGKFPAEFDTYQEVNENEFVFCLFDVEETPRCVGLSEYQGMITGAYTVMKTTTNFNNKFLYYFYLNLDSDKRMKPLYTGLRNTISKDNFFCFKTFVPPLATQTAIANFLDEKTAKIDQAIANKQKLIELLKERKQIIIQNAVTKGLNPKVKMKDSGVEWIGKIPEGWDVIKIKRIAKKITDGEHISPFFTDKGMPFLSAKDIRDGYIEFPNNKFVKVRDGEKFRERCNPERGDILLVSRGATIGRVSKVETDVDFCLLGSVILIKSNKKIEINFLSRALGNRVLQESFLNTSHHSAQQAIYIEKVAEVYIPFPRKDEQKFISQHIETQSAKIDKAISLQEQQIEKLKEYKATLIDSAVTGKIKVSES